MCDKVAKRGEFLEDVSQSLNNFNDLASSLENVLKEINEVLESREISRMPDEEYAAKINKINEKLNSKRNDFDDCLKIGKDLISQRDVTDTAAVRDRMKVIISHFYDILFNILIS